jgi:hypothetical protein
MRRRVSGATSHSLQLIIQFTRGSSESVCYFITRRQNCWVPRCAILSSFENVAIQPKWDAPSKSITAGKPRAGNFLCPGKSDMDNLSSSPRNMRSYGHLHKLSAAILERAPPKIKTLISNPRDFEKPPRPGLIGESDPTFLCGCDPPSCRASIRSERRRRIHSSGAESLTFKLRYPCPVSDIRVRKMAPPSNPQTKEGLPDGVCPRQILVLGRLTNLQGGSHSGIRLMKSGFT